MKSLAKKTWELKGLVENTDLLATIATEFSIELSPATTSTLLFHDDFDRHLWKANYLLCQVDSQTFRLIENSGSTEELKAVKDARFWWQFSESKTRDQLQQLIGLRALVPLVTLSLFESDCALRNSEQKIVVKGRLTQLLVNNKIIQYFTLQTLRGYAKYFTQMEAILAPLIKAEINDFGLKFMLLDHARQAFESTQDIQLLLTENMPTEQAVRTMAIAMLEQAELHVGGVISDTDTEFLHQFRVNFRKLRSLISLLKKSLPATTVNTLRPKLASIVEKTNKLRDLDVFLLDQDKYSALLPENFSSGLNDLYRLIEKQRQQEKTKVARYFSNSYMADVAICAAELSSSAAVQTPMATKPVLQVVKRLLLNRYHKMLAMSAAIHSQTPDEEVHELRIEFKKLRYLIEFFVDLLPKKSTTRLISQIKKIQTVLGDFNDYSTQIGFLNGYIDDTRIEMSKALYGLIAVLHQKQVEERLKVSSALAAFFTEDMTIKFDLLFAVEKPGDSE